MEQIATDLPEVILKLTEINQQITSASQHVTGLLQKVNNGEYDTSNGLGFLEAKHHLLLEYIINITYTMLLKVNGKPLEGAPAIDRLVEIRTVLEKMRPIDKKLKYQVDKLIKISSDQGKGLNENNPLSFKPNLANLSSKFGDSDESSSDDENGTGSKKEEDQSGIYVAPKVRAMPYDEEVKDKKGQLSQEKKRMRALNSSLIKELRTEYSEEPDEIKDDWRATQRNKIKEKEQERERYEEDNMKRLMLNKNDKRAHKKLEELSDLTKVEKFAGFGDGSDTEDEMYEPKKKSKKATSKGPGAKKMKAKGGKVNKKKGKFKMKKRK